MSVTSTRDSCQEVWTDKYNYWSCWQHCPTITRQWHVCASVVSTRDLCHGVWTCKYNYWSCWQHCPTITRQWHVCVSVISTSDSCQGVWIGKYNYWSCWQHCPTITRQWRVCFCSQYKRLMSGSGQVNITVEVVDNTVAPLQGSDMSVLL